MNSIDAHCFSCGYDTLLMIGGLMSNHHVYSSGPIRCDGCHAITTANYKALPLRCGVCKSAIVSPMRAPVNWLGDDDPDAGEWAGRLLPALRSRGNDHLDLPGHYKCPKCCKFELRFGTNYSGHGYMSAD